MIYHAGCNASELKLQKDNNFDLWVNFFEICDKLQLVSRSNRTEKDHSMLERSLLLWWNKLFKSLQHVHLFSSTRRHRSPNWNWLQWHNQQPSFLKKDPRQTGNMRINTGLAVLAKGVPYVKHQHELNNNYEG